MKKILLALFAALLCTCAFATDELISVLRNPGNPYWEYDSGDIIAGPCSEHGFRVQYTIPTGFTSVKHFEWYVNDVLIKTTTQIDYMGGVPFGVALLKVSNRDARFVCKVIYQTSNGTPSAAYASPEFLIISDPIGFTLNGPFSLNVGSQTVNYSLSVTGGTGTYVPPAGSYTITWTYPGGWTLNGVTNGGMNASFTADQSSGGEVKATIVVTSGCGYNDAKKTTVSRIYPAPTFSSPNPSQVCSSSPSQNFSVNGQPLAVSYTYTIQPSFGSATGITFAANGQHSLTTTATIVNINFNESTDHILFLKVVANYNGGFSAAAQIQINYNTTINWTPYITFDVACFCAGPSPVPFQATAPWVSGATYYWYLDGWLVDVGAGAYTTGLWWNGETAIQVKAVTACSSTELYSQDFPTGCWCSAAKSAGEELTLYPNPAQSQVSVNLKGLQSKKPGTVLTQIKEIKVLDKLGALKRFSKYPAGTQNATIDISSLPADIYIMEISDGVNRVKKQLSKVK